MSGASPPDEAASLAALVGASHAATSPGPSLGPPPEPLIRARLGPADYEALLAHTLLMMAAKQPLFHSYLCFARIVSARIQNLGSGPSFGPMSPTAPTAR